MGAEDWGTFGQVVHGHNLGWAWLAWEVFTRLFMLACFLAIRTIRPRISKVWAQQAWHYAYPHKDDMISTKMMTVYILLTLTLLPPPLIALRTLKKWSLRRICDDLLVFIMGISMAVLMTLIWIELGKRTISVYRPDYLSRCTNIIDTEKLSLIVSNMTGYQEWPCSPEADFNSTLLSDGRMSWPSGHSGTSCCVYLFVCLWFYIRFLPYRRFGIAKIAYPGLLALFPLFVGITRILDYRHHWTDVLSGAIIGSVFAIIAFRFYYNISLPPYFISEPNVIFADTAAQGAASGNHTSHDSVIVPVKNTSN